MPSIRQLIQDENVRHQYALVYTPRQGKRQRFPSNCVYVQTDEATALAAEDKKKHLHAAQVCGPSRSSEGFMLYYLIKWLA